MGDVKDKGSHYFFDPDLFVDGSLPRDVCRVTVPGFAGPLYCVPEIAEALERMKRDGQPDTARTFALWFGAEKYTPLTAKHESA